jgi:hypothetical protein
MNNWINRQLDILPENKRFQVVIFADTLPLCITSVRAAGEIELPQHHRHRVLGTGSRLTATIRHDAVSSRHHPVGGHQGGSAAPGAGAIGGSKVQGYQPGVFAVLRGSKWSVF